MGQLGPVIYVGFSDSSCEVGYQRAGVRPGSFGGIEWFSHDVVKLCRLLCIELLAVFINPKKDEWCGAFLVTAAIRVCFIKDKDDLFDVFAHQYLHFTRQCEVQCHAEVGMDLSTADSHLSGSVLEDAFYILCAAI
jgi:hypothetical protein